VQAERGESENHGGFLHAWINGHFRVLEDGETIFYPLGAFGRRGYAVASTEQELILRKTVLTSQRIARVALIGFALFFTMTLATLESWKLLLVVVGSWPISWVFARAYFWTFTRGMESVDIPNSFLATWRSMGQTVHPLLLVSQSLFLVFVSGYSMLKAYQTQDSARLLIGLIIATALIPYGVALWSWRQTWKLSP
jgi:hypothetical protein